MPGQCIESFYLDSWPANSESECQKACRSYEGCRYYTYFGGELRCAGYADCVSVQDAVNERTGVILCPKCVTGEVTCGGLFIDRTKLINLFHN